jgi:glycosyltransferase involved in cell wall biosynthesis
MKTQEYKINPEKDKMKLNVSFLSPFPPEPEGVGVYVQNLVLTLAKLHANIRMTVFTREMPDLTPLEMRNLVCSGRLTIAPIWKENSLLSLFQIVASVRRNRIQLMNIHYGPHKRYGFLLGEPLLLLLIFARILRIRTIITVHSFWTLDELRSYLKNKIPTYIKRVNLISRFILALISQYAFVVQGLLLQLASKTVICVNYSGSGVVKYIGRTHGLEKTKIHEIVHGVYGDLSEISCHNRTF